jgi:hypothetical protein
VGKGDRQRLPASACLRGTRLIVSFMIRSSQDPREIRRARGVAALVRPAKNSHSLRWNSSNRGISHPKLLRVALPALVCVIGFKGIQVLIAPPVQVIDEPTKQEIHETRSLVQQLVANSAGEGRAGRGEGCRRGCRRRGQRSGGGRPSSCGTADFNCEWRPLWL